MFGAPGKDRRVYLRCRFYWGFELAADINVYNISLDSTINLAGLY